LVYFAIIRYSTFARIKYVGNFSVPRPEAAKHHGRHARYRIVPAAVGRCAPTIASWDPILQKMIQARIGASPARRDVVPSARMEAVRDENPKRGRWQPHPAEKIAAASWSARSLP